ncbi:flagellar basal-body MS-ring/collar protein FliF [Novosphingobium sp.]|uniref:flagellar basal-body MS-ring/collar protein FliF n=1 Tax=Novosphingobium sp. TaxID=1874826 RepID=UPI0035B2002F
MTTSTAENAASLAPGSARRPNFWLLALLVTVAVFGLYWFFVRTTYVPVLVNLDAQDAAEIAKVLDGKKIGYRFEDDGRTIAVVNSEADKARIELAGSELPMKGQIGFELFNQSDMGLTEFAQKINYQRALQGELARTILLLDGIQTVRVHLGLPEHNMFRGEQDKPKASVTLILKPGRSLSSATVEGIQRLVAGAVPDLPQSEVAVLDGSGRVVSPEIARDPAPDAASDAILNSARERLKSAVTRLHPDLRFGLVASLRYVEPGEAAKRRADDGQSSAHPVSEILPRGVPDYVYAVRITTEEPIMDGVRADIERAAQQELGLDADRGDSLVFLVGPIQPEAPRQQASLGSQIVAQAAPAQAASGGLTWRDWWMAAPLLAIPLLLAALWSDRRRRLARRKDQLSEFANLLRQRLEAEGEA